MGELYEQICSWDNLRLAHQNAARGKRGKHAAAAFEYNLADNLLALQSELISQTYQPGPYHSFYVHDPKHRLTLAPALARSASAGVSAAPFRDRVVHHALCKVTAPILERGFIYDSYANRVGKGTHRALDRAQAFARRFRYVLQCDVEQFFPAIDHRMMRRLLARKIHDGPTLWLIDQILASGVGILAEQYTLRYFAGDTLLDALRPRGLPIGNLTSQFWANCYLTPFDHFVQRELRCPGYVRYVDDGLLFGDDLRSLWAWRDGIVERLAQFRLTIHPGAQPRPTSEGVPFLGFVVYPDHRRLKRRKVVAYRRKLDTLVADWRARAATREMVEASWQGWVNHARYGDTWGLRCRLANSIPPFRGGVPCPRTP